MSDPSTTEHADGRRAWYVVGVLLLVYMVHHLDRMIVTLLLEPIGREFALTDSQLGLLAGLAYAIPFALAGIPLGMLVDRVNRVRLVTVLLTVWSGLTALSALATGFWTLLLARVGVAAAESGGTPANVSIISDRMPPERRATALGVYYMGSGLGTIIGFSAAGAVASQYGWRAAFLVVGVPGLLLALLLWRTVREPPRRAAAATPAATPPPLREALRIIVANRAALHVIAGSTIAGMVAIGLTTWLPALLVRNHGASLATVGTLIAFTIAPLGALGSLAGGRIGDLIHARGPAGVALFLAACISVTIPAAAVGVLTGTLAVAVGAFAVQTLAQVLISAPGYATVMHQVPAGIRGVSASVMQVLANVLGFGVGTQVIGLASDALAGVAHADSLRYAMLGLALVNVWSVLHFLLAARALRRAALPATTGAT